ncbi:MAG: hypothetical protein B7X46_13665, partial [Thiomonas sp. 15-66-11]
MTSNNFLSSPSNLKSPDQEQVREVRTRYGDMVVRDRPDLVSKSLIDYGEWAQNELDAFANFIAPESVVLDVGAYIGSHSRAFSQMVGEKGLVLAFEPHPSTFKILQANIWREPLGNIKATQAALGNCNGTRCLQNTSSENYGASYIGPCQDTTMCAHSVRVHRLDDLRLELESPISFVKIDVEGNEVDVLLGSEKTLALHQPVIYAETNT